MIEVETKNASLDTLAVTILALHVSGKQMTQAVFKQLPEGYEKEGDPIWGVVRYSGLWIIFSSKGTLYRRELSLETPSHMDVRNAEKALERLDAKYSTIRVDPENPVTTKWRLELTWERAAIVEHLEQVTNYYNEDLDRQLSEIALSKLQQLFIAV